MLTGLPGEAVETSQVTLGRRKAAGQGTLWM